MENNWRPAVAKCDTELGDSLILLHAQCGRGNRVGHQIDEKKAIGMRVVTKAGKKRLGRARTPPYLLTCLNDKHGPTRPGQFKCRHQSIVAASDHDNVVRLRHLHFSASASLHLNAPTSIPRRETARQALAPI